jgi:dihydroorotase
MRTLIILAAALAAHAQQYDLLIRNGHVIDPANGINEVRDVAVAGTKIARVSAGISAGSARRVVDASGLYVTPGLIDIHAHVYLKFVDGSIPYTAADAICLPSGVTTVVDAGSSGWKNFADFHEKFIATAKTRVLAFLNIAPLGTRSESEQTPPELDAVKTAELIKQYASVLVGVKTAHYWTSKPFDAGHPPWASVERSLEAGRLAGKPVMVDFWPRPERPYPDLILRKLRPGDIHTHVFAQQFPIVDKSGKVYPYMFEAQKRGVYFDVGHGAGSFWFRIADPSLKGGFVPDSISTDMHMASQLRTAFSMINVMSKFLNMGMPLEDVIRRSTVNPAREIRRTELGTLSQGAEADIAVLRLDKGRFGYADCGGAKMIGDSRLEALLTVRRGEVVFDIEGLSMPEWHKTPSAYWFTPFLQGDRSPVR